MLTDLHDHDEIERFLRDANAEDLLEERSHLQDLMANITPAAPEAFLKHFAARIAYELRFRVQQPV
jgi:hypothetical protein